MSRHLYDLERLMDSPFGIEALQDRELYAAIVAHRAAYYSLKYVDYDKLSPSSIEFVPPASALNDWKDDYKKMCSSFIYGSKLPFDKLLARIEELQDRFRDMA